MKPSTALDRNRPAVREAVGRFRTANPRVFGSVLHGNDGEGSDLDLLVDPAPRTSLLDLAGLQIEIETRTGIKIDLRTPAELHPRFRSKVLAEAVSL